ncbi:MAG: N-acetylmuramic acid 6-phosphate etherase [Clostridia bacterium]|nr:N-acetylmuramic acid 6-phosphate etherase [Clostridia bacterium]
MIKTEMRNPVTTHIDRMTCEEMVRVMQDENLNAAKAVGEVTDSVAEAIDKISERMKKGGRLFYVGCGTSGRLGVLDASECPPTYGVKPELVVGIIAGGDRALRVSVEGAEDDPEAGRRDLEAHSPGELDSVVGISVAGGAAYVLGAVELAKERGALTVALTGNADSRLANACDISIAPDTGAEVVTGSTRMKAGSAHKMILNMISTGVMIKLGNVYENYMINLRPTNKKLRERMIGIASNIAGISRGEAEKRLEAAGWSIPKALGSEDKRVKTDG